MVGTPIGNLGDLSPRAAAALASADVIACEDTRRTRGLLSHAGISGKELVALHSHNEASVSARLAARAQGGEVVALVSDAGMPMVSDPGARLVSEVLRLGVPLSAVPGPSALLHALVLSGIEASRFCFEGFLPAKGPQRSARLQALASEERATVLFEAPHRLARTLSDLEQACGPDRRVAIARELTKVHEEVWRGTLSQAVRRAAEIAPRGEHTLVLQGAPAAPPPDDESVDRAVAALLEEGKTPRSVAQELSALFGIPKRQAYEAALRARAQRPAHDGDDRVP